MANKVTKHDAHVKKYKRRLLDAAHYAANRERIIEKRKVKRELNKEAINEKGRQYRVSNKEKLSAYQKDYYAANKEKKMAASKAYYDSHKDEKLCYNRRYLGVPENRKRVNLQQIAYQRRNPAYTLARHVLKRVYSGIKSGLKKSNVFDLVGYTSEDLRAYMETLFVDGMSWDNHGEWHIDHIKPVAKFKAEGVTDVAIINALSNLQPLWATDNLSKGSRYD